jgi:hypothetical protein
VTGVGAAAATAATLTGAQILAALTSPLPLLILGGIAVVVWLPIAVLLLTPVWSTCPDRNARATAMLDRVLAAIPGSRCATPPTGTDAVEPDVPDVAAEPDVVPAPRRRRRWRRRNRLDVGAGS